MVVFRASTGDQIVKGARLAGDQVNVIQLNSTTGSLVGFYGTQKDSKIVSMGLVT